MIGDPSAPFITSLASTYGQATNYIKPYTAIAADSAQVHSLWPLIIRF